AAFAPEEAYAGDIDQQIDEQYQQRIQQPQPAEGVERIHEKAEAHAADQPGQTEGEDGVDRRVMDWMRPRQPAREETIAPHRVNDACSPIDNGQCCTEEREHSSDVDG